VINLAGDGDFLMTAQELATATGYGAGRGIGRLICIVVDNGTYGTIRMHQEREYPGRVSGSDLFNPDFAALARAYGFEAESISETAAFEPAFRAALARAVPTLLHLKLDHPQHLDCDSSRGARPQLTWRLRTRPPAPRWPHWPTANG
jgi:acetolactate synthase-1/2/3 large subunit